MRLRETFEQATPLVRYVAPAQTVCNYWNYWFTYFPNALSDVEPLLGGAFRQTLTRFPAAQQVETPLGGYSGVAGQRQVRTGRSGRRGRVQAVPEPASSTHASTRRRAKQDADCQNGQIGYALGRLPVPGQSMRTPRTGSPTSRDRAARPRCSGARTASARSSDTRNPRRAPETWEGNRP